MKSIAFRRTLNSHVRDLTSYSQLSPLISHLNSTNSHHFTHVHKFKGGKTPKRRNRWGSYDVDGVTGSHTALSLRRMQTLKSSVRYKFLALIVTFSSAFKAARRLYLAKRVSSAAQRLSVQMVRTLSPPN